MALYTLVGLPGSGKSLYSAYVVYKELTKIMRNNRTSKWYDVFDFFHLWSKRSMYDLVALNYNFNDSRGNFTRFCYSLSDCKCDDLIENYNYEYVVDIDSINDDKIQKFKQHWEYGGYCLGITDLPEVYNIKNCQVHMDEAGTMLANMDWDKMPDGYRKFLTEHRKNKTDLFHSFDIFVYTQHKDLIEITLRRISDRIYLIRHLFGYSKDPTKVSWFSKVPAMKLWVYWRHEVREKDPPLEYDSDGVPITPDTRDMVESLDPFTWLCFPTNKYRACYDTLEIKKEMKRRKVSPLSLK